MDSISSLVYHIRPSLLASFFATFGSDFSQVDWEQSSDRLVKQLYSTLNPLSFRRRLTIESAIARIESMVSDYCQRLLIQTSTVDSGDVLSTLSSSLERSCWVYLHDAPAFEQSETVSQADYTRGQQYWSYYLTEVSDVNVDDQNNWLNAFNRLLSQVFNVKQEAVDTRLHHTVVIDEAGVEQSEWHITIYHSQLPETYLVFDDQQTLASLPGRLVLPYSLIYTPSTGMLEVLAPDQSRRLILVRLFTSVLLRQNTIPYRSFTLQPLLRLSSLPFDAADGIRSVSVVRMRLEDSEWNSHLNIDLPPMLNGTMTIHDYIRHYFGQDNPFLTGSFTPVKATIVIRFDEQAPISTSNTLSISISLPNQCDLRNRSQKERLLGEKYLIRWGLMDSL